MVCDVRLLFCPHTPFIRRRVSSSVLLSISPSPYLAQALSLARAHSPSLARAQSVCHRGLSTTVYSTHYFLSFSFFVSSHCATHSLKAMLFLACTLSRGLSRLSALLSRSPLSSLAGSVSLASSLARPLSFSLPPPSRFRLPPRSLSASVARAVFYGPV